MRDFKRFAAAMAAFFKDMSASRRLFRVAIDGDEIWQSYLAAFPAGENPIFRVRTEHDGSYDRATIRKIGNVVRINEDGSLTSIWDTPDLDYPYSEVAQILGARVGAASIAEPFFINEAKIGYVSTTERGDPPIIWNHFHFDIPRAHLSNSVAEVLGTCRSEHQVFTRGLREIKPEALTTILELIEGNAIYRGQEHLRAVREFMLHQRAYNEKTTEQARTVFAWRMLGSPATRFRNTVIGTLAVDLSDGVELTRAVASFEAKVAPENYKRPTALVTQSMIDKALAQIAELGLEPALERRHARISDVSVNNVLWVNTPSASKMKGGLGDVLKPTAPRTKPDLGKVITQIGITNFLNSVVPTATSIELLMENRHQKNLMSVTAPVHDDVEPLFKWGNNFAWSYNGNVTDSIKEKVKRAGGNIQADLRVSLAWHNFDDLDLHAQCPYGHISFMNKRGILDVDMNAGSGRTRTPVENLAFNRPEDGVYTIRVDQYQQRETDDVGFELEIECGGEVHQLVYDKVVRRGAQPAVVFTMKGGKLYELKTFSDIKHSTRSQEVWGLKTETYIPVNTLILSPNHWEHSFGNQHWFFILEGAHNPEPVRGIYNEFLRSDLEVHRKVFELLGNKTKAQPSADQLSGLGFSSTNNDQVVVRVNGGRTFNINF